MQLQREPIIGDVGIVMKILFLFLFLYLILIYFLSITLSCCR